MLTIQGRPVAASRPRFGDNTKPLMFYLKANLGNRYTQLQFEELPGSTPGVPRIKISSKLTPAFTSQMDRQTAQELFRTWVEFTSVNDDQGKAFWDSLKNGVVSTRVQGRQYEIQVDNAFMPPDWRPGGGLA